MPPTTGCGPKDASPEASPKVPTPGGHIVSPPHLIYTCDYETNWALAMFGAGPGPHFRCVAAPGRAPARRNVQGGRTGHRGSRGSMAVGRGPTVGGSVQGVIDGVPVILVLIAGIGAPLAGWYATRRYRNPGTWFVLGAMTGPIALALLALAPPGRCPECDARVDGWAAVCDRCDEPLPARAAFGSPTPSAAPPGPVAVMAGVGSSTARPLAPPTPIDRARSSSRRDVGNGWPDRPMASPTSLGVRPTFTPSNYVAATTGDQPSGDVLSTGVYLSGNAGLEVGACYAIARDGDRVRVFGPVDAGQLTIRHEGPVDDFEVTAMDDRVIISGRAGRSGAAFVFRTIGGMRAADLELALGGPMAGTAP